MDEKEQDNVAAFDTLFTTNRIQIMKILLPCFERPMQKYLAVYIKYQELQYTISYLAGHPYHICSDHPDEKQEFKKLLPALLPYCSEAQKRLLHRLEQMMDSLETYREMMELMQMMEMMQADTAADPAGEQEPPWEGSSDPEHSRLPDMDLLLSMLSPEQQAMMEFMKGGLTYGNPTMDE